MQVVSKSITNMAFYYTLLLILPTILHIEGSAFKHQGYTPLKINEIACTAEKLKVTLQFIVLLGNRLRSLEIFHVV